MKSKICLIRHGITRGNRDRLYYGQSDIPLIEDGEKEISRLAKEGIYPDSEDAVYYTQDCRGPSRLSGSSTEINLTIGSSCCRKSTSENMK